MFFESLHDVQAYVEECRKAGKKIVSTNGCFDILHKGHAAYLREAKEQGDVLIVGLNTDNSVKKIKGPSRPINAEKDRALLLGELKPVDATFLFDEDTPEAFLRALKPDTHVKGADWKGKDIPEEAVVKEWGAKIHYASFIDGYSSSKIIERSQAATQATKRSQKERS